MNEFSIHVGELANTHSRVLLMRKQLVVVMLEEGVPSRATAH